MSRYQPAASKLSAICCDYILQTEHSDLKNEKRCNSISEIRAFTTSYLIGCLSVNKNASQVLPSLKNAITMFFAFNSTGLLILLLTYLVPIVIGLVLLRIVIRIIVKEVRRKEPDSSSAP